MTTEAQTNEQDVSTAQPVSISDQDLSFGEYEKLRRGETVVRAQKQSAPEQKAHEQKDHVESDTTKAEEKLDDHEDTESDHDENEVKDDEKKDKPRKKGGFQKRIDKLNARVSERDREVEYWKSLALKDKSAGDNNVKPKVDEPKAKDGKPSPDDFETHAAYVEALTDWKVEQKDKQRKAEEQQNRIKDEQAKLLKSHSDRVKTFSEKVDDFNEAIEAVDDVPMSRALQELIISSDHGPELMYELAKNREEYERISHLSPLACARELGKLESKIIQRHSSEEKKSETNKITKAPKPIEPVGTGKGAVKKSIDDPDLSFSDYERLRREQMKRR